MTDAVLPPADPSPQTPGVPAGWYNDPASGRQRWWDGTAWTEQFQVVSSSGAAIAALVLGIIGFVLTPIPFFVGLFVGGVPALLGVIFGIVGMVNANRGQGKIAMPLIGFLLGMFALIGIPLGSGTVW